MSTRSRYKPPDSLLAFLNREAARKDGWEF
jgi:hypothetical protein